MMLCFGILAQFDPRRPVPGALVAATSPPLLFERRVSVLGLLRAALISNEKLNGFGRLLALNERKCLAGSAAMTFTPTHCTGGERSNLTHVVG